MKRIDYFFLIYSVVLLLFGFDDIPRPESQRATNIVGVENEDQIPTQYSLSQHYPNPFNPSTTIQFSLPRAAHVALKVFNIPGEEIATLVSEERDAGTYETQWNAVGIASGVYLYRLQADNYTEVKKLVLLR